VIADKFVDLYARNSGLRDKLIAERDVVLTYALRALVDTRVMDHLAFKGGTCLRKLVFGSVGRFSEDLDFTIDSDEPDDDVLVRIVETFNREHFGVAFLFDEYYKTDDDTSFGGDVVYRHSWNDAGRFRLQVSLRERPTLPATARAMQYQSYFERLEFPTFDVRSLETIEMIAEKVRAAFQRAKVRDLYDLYRFATTPFDGELLRSLVVLKLWQVRDPFVPPAFFDKLRSSKYDWADLQRLLRLADRLEPEALVSTVEQRFEMLRHPTELEQQIIADARRGRSHALVERLRGEIRQLAGVG
jgi:predicted nucleotidyltransferase component of viral defense system